MISQLKKPLFLFFVVVAFVLAALFHAAATGAQSAESPRRLFEPLGDSKAPARDGLATASSTAAVSEQEIRINFGTLDLASARALGLPLLDGLTRTAVRSETEGFEASADGGLVWRGKIQGPGEWSGDVTLSVKGRALSGLVYAPDGVYEIIPQQDFRHLLVKLDQHLFAPCGGALTEPATPGEAAGFAPDTASESKAAPAPEDTSSGAAVASDDGSRLDVLVVYSDDVRAALGGTTQAEAFAQEAINSTNTAYINSDIHTRVRLAGTLEVAYDENGDLSAALSWASGNSAISAARNTARADMVAFLVNSGTTACGIGRLMTRSLLGAGFQHAPYTATARGCAVGNLSFAHELGHNQGCQHNPENGGPPDVSSYPYAYGHYVDQTFRTVMSYSDPCTPPSYCTRVAYFSNPAVNYNGVPTGVADQRDNHRVINDTASIVALFRESVIGDPPANDNLANAQALGGSGGTFDGSNNGATKESGEPFHAFRLGGASVWFTWQAPAGGSTTFTTAGSTFNTALAVYTGSAYGGLTTVAYNDDVNFATGESRVTFNAAAGTTYRVAVDGSAAGVTGGLKLNWSQAVVAPTVQLSSNAFSVNEPDRKVLINVTRAGDLSNAASVNYATSDGTATRLGDYTQALGTLSFAAGEATKAVTVFVTDDALQEPAETFTLTLTGAAGATLGATSAAVVTVNSDDATTGPNPVGESAFNADFFVRQHYVDFLGREPDAEGLAHWTNQTTNCGNPNLEVCRVNVSAAFFQSIEFQNTGYLVYRFYKAAYGDAASPNVAGAVPAVRLEEFLPDTQRIGAGVVVNLGGWQTLLEANKQAYALEFVQRPRFLAAYPAGLAPTQFVEALRANTGAALSQAEADALVAELSANNTSAGRASVLRKVAEDADLQTAERNRAFVLMEYFGYLRRNPDDAPNSDFSGWKFWLDKLNEFGGDYVNAEMVKAFITSIEYRQRFGQ